VRIDDLYTYIEKEEQWGDKGATAPTAAASPSAEATVIVYRNYDAVYIRIFGIRYSL
jgi:hypothetical protein